jgi:hypothetical protein
MVSYGVGDGDVSTKDGKLIEVIADENDSLTGRDGRPVGRLAG